MTIHSSVQINTKKANLFTVFIRLLMQSEPWSPYSVGQFWDFTGTP